MKIVSLQASGTPGKIVEMRHRTRSASLIGRSSAKMTFSLASSKIKEFYPGVSPINAVSTLIR